MKCDKYMNICFKMKEIVDINTPRKYQLTRFLFKSIMRKIRNTFLHLYSQTCLRYHYRIVKNDKLLPNCQNFWHRVCESLTRFFTSIHVERKMQIQLLIKQKEILPRMINHRSRSLRIVQKKHFQFHHGEK